MNRIKLMMDRLKDRLRNDELSRFEVLIYLIIIGLTGMNTLDALSQAKLLEALAYLGAGVGTIIALASLGDD